MTAFFDQVTETADWRRESRHTDPTRRLTDIRATKNRPVEEPATEAQAKAKAPAVEDLARHRRAALLSRVVATQVLPRLASARVPSTRIAAARLTPADPADFVATENDTAELVDRLLQQDPDSAVAFIQTLQQRGATPAALYLGMLPDAARRLGEFWDADRIDFSQVTISMGRLQQVARSLSLEFQLAAVIRPHPDTVLLLSAPDGQHTFGLVILAEFFRRDGWHVMGGPLPSGNNAVSLVRNTWVDVAGFSIGSTRQLEPLAAVIRAVRKASLNRDLSVMVGGPLVLLRPDLVARIGADLAATDARSAVRQASGLLAMRTAAD